ncbi:hypothetical protein [Thalassospira xiamenensis]|uniref:Uncharacterized protein n=1 Tax=Thalassospira xiamenensis TaxID=220697 RepID=A0A285TM54_9PROT|nr:hypothetical protein [Thalassospira xiamenensis]SOC21571.1 hypothetical protein SAMN05428964_103443 [Thalassospira xiamenensis]
MYSLIVAVLSISLGVILALASAIYLGNAWFSNSTTNQVKHLLAVAEQVAAASKLAEADGAQYPLSYGLNVNGYLSSNPSGAVGTEDQWVTGGTPIFRRSWSRSGTGVWLRPIENFGRQVTLQDIEDSAVCQAIEKINGTDNNIGPIITSTSSVSLGPVKFDCIGFSYHILFAYKE